MRLPILKFSPIYKNVIWGGTRIAAFKGLPPVGENIGESWELSTIDGGESVVDGGEYDGIGLRKMLEIHGAEIMGERLFAKHGAHMPLLIKFIDSADNLSVQVHPDDALAGRRHNSPGKTEMWYSVLPDEDALLYVGFNRDLTPYEFRRMLDDGTVAEALDRYNTRHGDMFFLPAGCVHSIGRGNLVLEIHEASDITYRIYDYGRTDADGRPRRLHIEESIEAINFSAAQHSNAHFDPSPGEENIMKSCPYFTASILKGIPSDTKRLNLGCRDSFTALVATMGNAIIIDPEGRRTELHQGQTALVPATTAYVDILSNEQGCEIVTVYA